MAVYCSAEKYTQTQTLSANQTRVWNKTLSGFLSAAMESRTERLRWLAYTFLLVTANVLDTVLSSVISSSKPRLSLQVCGFNPYAVLLESFF